MTFGEDSVTLNKDVTTTIPAEGATWKKGRHINGWRWSCGTRSWTGELKPGDRLTGELELARLHKVSRTTARLAVKELENESLVYRRRGSGTFVSSSPGSAQVTHSSFSAFVKGLPGLVSREVLSMDWGEAGPELSAALGVPSQAAMLRFHRLDRVEGKPMAFDHCWIAGAFAHRLGREDLETLDFFEHWQRRQGMKVSKATLELYAAAATAEQAGILGVKRGSPVLLELSDIFIGELGAARFVTAIGMTCTATSALSITTELQRHMATQRMTTSIKNNHHNNARRPFTQYSRGMMCYGGFQVGLRGHPALL